MTDNIEFITQNAEEVNTGIDTNQDYIATIKSMKENSVSKADYDKLREENKALLKTLVEGGQIESPVDKEPVDVDALRKYLYSDPDRTFKDCDYVQKTLELRNALIEKGEPDPFLPFGSRINPTREEIELAENTAEIYAECLEYANGDSEVFINELMRRCVDNAPMSRSKRR